MKIFFCFKYIEYLLFSSTFLFFPNAKELDFGNGMLCLGMLWKGSKKKGLQPKHMAENYVYFARFFIFKKSLYSLLVP
jgi:hypothetical protein